MKTCMVAQILNLALLLGAGAWLLENNHPTAGGFALAFAFIVATCWSCQATKP